MNSWSSWSWCHGKLAHILLTLWLAVCNQLPALAKGWYTNDAYLWSELSKPPPSPSEQTSYAHVPYNEERSGYNSGTSILIPKAEQWPYRTIWLISFHICSNFLSLDTHTVDRFRHMTQPAPISDLDRFKLEKKRERNRIAASKCRQRKLERISDLGTYNRWKF